MKRKSKKFTKYRFSESFYTPFSLIDLDAKSHKSRQIAVAVETGTAQFNLFWTFVKRSKRYFIVLLIFENHIKIRTIIWP